MKKITRWRPDTCGCVIEYEWDDSQDENARVHTFKKALKVCPDHATLTGQGHYNQILSETSCKSMAFSIIQEAYPEVTEDNYVWFFNKKRELQISLVGVDISPAKKGELQAALNTRLGAGKARVI